MCNVISRFYIGTLRKPVCKGLMFGKCLEFGHLPLKGNVTVTGTDHDCLSELGILEPHREKTGYLPMRKQRRRSASR